MIEQTVLIPINNIVDNPYQHRDQEDPAAVEELAISIARNGLQQFPAVRAVNSHYELVFGHTRRAAYRLLATQGVPTADIKADKQYAQIPVYVRELTDRQMFELAIVENLKRRDPKPTEKAKAIQKYMDEFKATSKEAGELFGMNDATARGMVRLLDLPADWQTSLDTGKITQGTARTALSIKKIIPAENLMKILKEIENGEDEDGNPVEPATVINNHLRWNSSQIEDMWSESRRDGKPRSNWQNGWLLDMKNFPNKLLPALTLEEALQALGIDPQNSKIAAKVNTWLMNKKGQTNFTEDEISELHLQPELLSKLEHLINPTACNTCPFYSVVYGTHYCGMKVCWNRKTVAWKLNIIQAASRDLGISVYAEQHGKFEALNSYDGADKQLFNKKNTDLRLIANDKVRGYHSQDFKGVNHSIFYVVITGKTLEGRKAGKKSSFTDSARQEMNVQQRRDELLKEKREAIQWEATLYLKSIFDGMKLEPLRVLYEVTGGMMSADISDGVELPEETDAELADAFQRKIAWEMLNEAITWKTQQEWSTITKAADDLTVLAKQWGVKLPAKFLKIASEYDAEIKSVAVETKNAKKSAGK